MCMQKLFGNSSEKNRVDEIKKRISEDYPDKWLRFFEFLCFPTDELLRDYLIRTIEESSPQRVLVVGGVNLFESLRQEELSAYNICVNTIHDLGWLCEFCKYSRNSRLPSIVVSNFPREYSPPTVRFVAGTNYVAKVGDVGGTVYKTVAPSGASITLCEEGDQKTTMSIFFYGVYTLSYYHEVMQSQHRRPDQLLMCVVLTTPDDNNLLIKEQEKLKSSLDNAEQRKILIQSSEDLELFPRFYNNDDQYTESTAYSGCILADFKVPERIPTREATH